MWVLSVGVIGSVLSILIVLKGIGNTILFVNSKYNWILFLTFTSWLRPYSILYVYLYVYIFLGTVYAPGVLLQFPIRKVWKPLLNRF